MKKIVSYLFTLFLLLPSVLAQSSAGTVAARFTVFYMGIKGALTGNPALFSLGLVAILPLIGVVVIVFGLMFFITKISIFKSPDHDRYARMIAFGVAFIGLAQQKIFNVILGLSTTFLTLAFILAIVFIFIMFVNYNRKAHFTSLADLRKVSGDSLKATRDLEKIKHELKHERALYNKTSKDLKKLDSDLNNITHLTGNELAQVDKIAHMLRKAAAAHKSGNSPAVDQYVTALSKDLGGLITTMQHEQKHSHHLSEMVSQIESELARWNHSTDKEKSEEDHLKSLFHKFAHTWGNKIEDKELHDIYKNDKKLQHELFGMLKSFRNHLHKLQALYDRIIAETENLEKSSYQRKHLEANAVRDNIMNQQFAEAHKHLDNLRAIIEYEPHVIKQLKDYDADMLQMLSVIDNEQSHITQLIQSRILKKLRKLRNKAEKKADDKKEKDKKDTREHTRQRRMFESWIDDVRSHLVQTIHVAHPYMNDEIEYEVNKRYGTDKKYRERPNKPVQEIVNFLNSEHANYHDLKKQLRQSKVDLIDFSQSLLDRLRGTSARIKVLLDGIPENVGSVERHLFMTEKRLIKIEELVAIYLGKAKKKKKETKDSWDDAQDAEYTIEN